MSAALTALEEHHFEAARTKLAQARQLRPESPAVGDALLRVDEGLHLQQLEHLRRLARQHEQQEAWDRAAAQYQAALELDPHLAFARDGLAHALARMEFGQRLQLHIDHPERLATDAVLAEAEAVLEEGQAVAQPGPVLAARLASLEQVIARAATPVTVELRSDGLTEVMVYRVGRLGTLSSHTLELRPGTYTIRGTRRGFRDVLITLTVTADGPTQPVVVRCMEDV
jgi:tetratricopeptide (TPR) repeat protein